MAELKQFVDSDALLAEWDRQSSRGHYEFDQTIMTFPKVTEAEIRAKAIDEFAKKLKDKSTFLKSLQNDYYGYVCEEEIDEIAEQLKGE